LKESNHFQFSHGHLALKSSREDRALITSVKATIGSSSLLMIGFVSSMFEKLAIEEMSAAGLIFTRQDTEEGAE
jgi:hypothetical protein